MTNSTSTSSPNELEEDFLDHLEENSDLEDHGTAKKLPGAFRTISEVAEEINVPQHVLRFWETRFKQVQPVKRSGGRRYYRAEDIVLLQNISDLLYIQGYTIKGVQRVLEEDLSRLSPNKDNTEVAQDEPINSDGEVITSVSIIADGQHSQHHIETIFEEVNRLKEKNLFLAHSLQSVLAELQVLRKIIVSEC
ncbi:MerR family transcriptional regulator [Commensalibacter intestini]|uniref:MerR family transcriptional regulator n=1 Tax=Commensalibacter intestini TaxID=479936 RepID=UPI000A367092|nr:MerR family transcriptional regulator [Commensalibacter intestini]